ncbi:MAG: PD-(D/E)XK nuclease domain-containing protein [Deltaproteobacteria bacterium]|nr:PD-(D/E)XK nuclease domain-containing protein [Deltaproteobacteria bacterium]
MTLAKGQNSNIQLEKLLFALFWGVGLRPIGEFHEGQGRSDIVVPHNGGHFVIELKISHNTVQDDRAKAKEALNQILTQGYAEGLGDPIILLGLAVNVPQRKTTTLGSRESAWLALTSGRSPKPPETSLVAAQRLELPFRQKTRLGQ